jgi:4-amino-4-deoxy-L-arabinose transferase-like glycosyltransferase
VSAPPPATPRTAGRGGALERAWSLAVAHPLVTVAIALAVQTLPALGSRDLWWMDETRHADVLHRMVHDGDWLVLNLNGAPYTDKPPLWFWFVALLSKALGSDGAPVWLLASALSGFAFLGATYALARTVLRAEKETALAATLLCLGSLLLVRMTHSTRMDLFFGALVVGSLALLHRGLSRDEPGGTTVLGFALAGAAALAKGPHGILFPLLAVLFAAAWRGRLKRLSRWDVTVGSAVTIAIVAAWVGSLWLGAEGGREYVRRIWDEQILHRAVDAPRRIARPAWWYLWLVPVLWMPWTGILLGTGVRRALSPAAWRDLVRGRREQDAGRVYLWAGFLSGFVLLSVLSGKSMIYPLPLFPALACLTADAWRWLPPGAAARAWTGVAVAFALLALALPWGNALLESRKMPPVAEGLGATAACFAATAVAVFALRRRAFGAPLLAAAGGGAAGVLVAALVVVPSLDRLLSPREQGEAIRSYVERGYEPLAFSTLRGIYSYDAGRTIEETRSVEEVRRFANRHARALIVAPEKYWNRDLVGFAEFVRVHRQHVEGIPHVVAVRPAPPATGP